MGWRSGADEREGYDGDAVGAAVGMGARGDDEQVDGVVRELIAQPVKVTNVGEGLRLAGPTRYL